MADSRGAQTAPAGRTPPPGGLSAVTTATEDIRVITLTGEIDHHTGDTLRHALSTARTGRPRCVIDMRQVTFMDSTGINILIAAHQAAAEAGGWLRLAAPTASVLRTLQIVGVDEVIACRPTLRDALNP